MRDLTWVSWPLHESLAMLRSGALWARRLIGEWYLFILCVITLSLLAMSWFLRDVNADVVVFSLISTQRMTFFYWSQDRLVSILPALTFPIRDPLWNFYVQMALQGASFFALVGLLVRFHWKEVGRDRDGEMLAGAVLIAGLLVTMVLNNIANYWFMFEQPYAMALLLFLVGMSGSMSGDVRRQIGAVPLVVLSVLLIPSTILFAPVVWLLGAAETRRKRFAITLGVIVAAFAINKVATALSAYQNSLSPLYTDFSVRRLVDGFPTAYDNYRRVVDIGTMLLFVILAGTILILRRRSLSTNLRLAYGFAPLFGIGWFVLFTANGWVELSGFPPRYYFPVFGAVILLITGAVAEVAALIADRMSSPMTVLTARRRVGAVVASCVALMSLGTVRLLSDDGVPVIAQGFDDVNATRPFGVDFVTGTYWRVWPTVLVARSQDLDVYGVAPRSEPTRSDVLAAIERKSPDLTLMCLDVDAPACVADFSVFVDQPWQLVSVDNEVPLVIRIEPSLSS